MDKEREGRYKQDEKLFVPLYDLKNFLTDQPINVGTVVMDIRNGQRRYTEIKEGAKRYFWGDEAFISRLEE